MFLGSSVLFAIYDAVTAARRERGMGDTFPMNSPATPEVIRMSCTDQFTDMVRDVRMVLTPRVDFIVLDMDVITATTSQAMSIFPNGNSPLAFTHLFLHASKCLQTLACFRL